MGFRVVQSKSDREEADNLYGSVKAFYLFAHNIRLQALLMDRHCPIEHID